MPHCISWSMTAFHSTHCLVFSPYATEERTINFDFVDEVQVRYSHCQHCFCGHDSRLFIPWNQDSRRVIRVLSVDLIFDFLPLWPWEGHSGVSLWPWEGRSGPLSGQPGAPPHCAQVQPCPSHVIWACWLKALPSPWQTGPPCAGVFQH